MRFAHFEFEPERDKLGEGPLSEVYRAVDTDLGRTVALKVLRAHAEIDPQADTRFLREAKHTSSLAHPNIATVYEYGKDRNTSYIALEFLQGRTLDRILKERSLGYEEVQRIALQVASALALVHSSGLIHRDLKPGNVMVLDDGSVKLLDFGIARASNESTITQHGMLVGTVLYMSPEQVRGAELDARSDVFALGAVLYHAATGSLPFPGKTFPEVCMAILDGSPRRPSEARPGFPPALEEFLLRCLHPEPARRFPDATAALAALQAATNSGATPAGAPAWTGRLAIPPVACRGGGPLDCEQFAGSLRRTLAAELARLRGIDVRTWGAEAPADAGDCDFVLRLSIEAEGHRARLLAVLAPGARRSADAPERREQVEAEGADDFEVEAALVRGAVRFARRALSETALRPPQAVKRDGEAALTHARHAHETLHRGTTKHLLAAVSSFRRAIDADPLCALAHAGLAEAMARKYLYWDGDETFLTEAREHAARALSLKADCAEAHTALGYVWQLLGHLTDAQRELRLAIQHDHDEWLAHRLLGAVLARTGDYKHASPLLLRATALRPTDISSYDLLHGVLQRLDRYEEAIEVADKGIAAARAHLAAAADDQGARLAMALLLVRMGHQPEAREQAARARELAPKDGFTAFHAARVHAALGDLPDALELLGKAQDRGYCIQAELPQHADLEVLRGMQEYQRLVG